MMTAERLRITFLNVGHFIDHLFMLIFATAAIGMAPALGLAYGEMLALATPGFILFGAAAPLAGWIGDRWGRHAIMVTFFIGIGLAAIMTGLASGPIGIMLGLAAIGLFAAIYHPVGIPMLVQGANRLGWQLGVNGVWGNMGVAAAPLLAGLLMVQFGWRSAFILPGIISVVIGLGFWAFVRTGLCVAPDGPGRRREAIGFVPGWQRVIFVIAVMSLAGGVVFNATTVSLPKLFEERLAAEAGQVIGYAVLASIVYAAASFVQLLAGAAVDRYPAKNVLFIAALGQALMMPIVAFQDGWPLFAAAFFMMLMVFSQIPIADALIARYVPDSHRGRAYSVKYILNLAVGAAAVPLIAGLHLWGGGFQTLFLVLGVGACLVTLSAFALPGVMRRPATQPAE